MGGGEFFVIRGFFKSELIWWRISNEDVNYDYYYAIFKIREKCKEKAKEYNIEFIDETEGWV